MGENGHAQGEKGLNTLGLTIFSFRWLALSLKGAFQA